MGTALTINLRIWTMYLLKIIFVSHRSEDPDQSDKNSQSLVRRIKIVNLVTFFVILTELVHEMYLTLTDAEIFSVFNNNIRGIGLVTVGVLHAVVGTMISCKLRTNF